MSLGFGKQSVFNLGAPHIEEIVPTETSAFPNKPPIGLIPFGSMSTPAA